MFDIFASAVAVTLLSPLLIPVAIILRLSGEGEIFYQQQRIGLGGKPFFILKFATMLKDSPNMPGGDITIGRDPRILPTGRFLRDTKINELPQLFNILLGDMSIIGWRPLTPRIAEYFGAEYWQALAHLRPGLSGIGSIIFRDEEKLLSAVADRAAAYRSAIVPYKAALELWYVEHQSFLLDIKLIMLTALAVVRPGTDLSNHLDHLPPPPATLIELRRVVEVSRQA